MERKTLRVAQTYLESIEQTQKQQIEQTQKLKELIQAEIKKIDEDKA